MANIGDLLGLAIKSREAIAKQASTVASTAATAVKTVQANSEAQKIKASYQPGEFIKPQDAQALIKAGTPVVDKTYQTPVYQGTSISKSAPIPMPVKIASAAASAVAGKNIKTEDFAGALKTAQGVGRAAIEGVKTARERYNVSLAQYKKTRYEQDAAKFGGANFSYVQQKALFDKLTPEEKDSLYFQATSPTDEGRKYGELQKQALNLQLADPAGVGASQYFPSSQVRKYAASAGEERESVLREMLIDIPGAAVKGFLSGRTFGGTSVLDGVQTGRQAPKFAENKQLQEASNAIQQGISIVASFAGGFKAYGAVAGKVGQALNKVPGKMGQTIAAHPIFSTYVLQNLGEEIVDGTIRKTTGQEYGPRDFALGMLMGFAFQGGHDWLKNVGIDKPTEAMLKVNQALAEAEQAKGAKLDRTEVEKVMYDTPIGNGMTFGNAFDRAKLAYKTGMAGSPFGGKMTSLKSSGITPSVTDMGVTIPDRIETPEVPKTSPLETEALKYKTPEEFVKAQGDTAYHVTKPANWESIKTDGFKVNKENKLFLSEEARYSESGGWFSAGEDATIESVVLSRNTKVLNIPTSDIEELGAEFEAIKKLNKLKSDKATVAWLREKGWYELNHEQRGKFVEQILKQNGYSGIRFTDGLNFGGKVLMLYGDDQAKLIKTTSQLTSIWNKAHGINKTGGAELPDAGRLSEEAAMRAEMKDNRLKPLVDRAKQLELSEEDFVKQFDDTLSGQNLTRKDTAQNVLKELDKMGLSPKEFYNKYIGLPKEIDNELMRLGAKAEAEGWSQDKLKKEHDLLSGEAERVAAANKMELEVGKPMPPDFLDELPTKKALTMEDVDWYNLSAEELDALPDHLKREIEAKWDEAYREDIKQDMEGVADNDLPDGWKNQARKVVTDFKAMVEGKNRFFLLGNKKYKGVYKGGEIQLSAGKGFKETINKLFLSGDMDTFTKNLNILAQHYKGTLFGDQVKRVLENWKTGLLDDPRIYTEYLEPELFKAIDEKVVIDPRKRLLADIGRLGREGLWADKTWGEYLKEFAHKAANPKILKQFGDFGKRLSGMIDEADMKTSMAAGRHVRLMGDAMTKMTGDELQALVKLSEGDLRPQDVKNQRVLAAFETWDKIRGEIATRAKEAGLKIKTSKGEEIDFVPRENYFPHFLQEDKLRDVLAQKNGIEVLTQRIAELNNIDQAEAFALVQRFINAKKKGKYGNLERARESLSSLVKLPDYAYEKDPRKVLMSYIVGANKRLADAEIFGPNAERAKVMIYKYFKEGGNSTTLQKVFDRMAGRELFDPTVTKLSQWVRSYNTVTKLGLSAVTNLGDIIKPFIRTDFWPAFKAVLQSFSAEGKAFAADTGVVQENVKKMLAEMGETKFSDKFMKYTGFEATETQLRRIGSLAGRNYAEILFSKLKKNPDNLFAIRRLEQLNIDTKAALERGNLTEEDLLMAGYKTVADMQPISRQDAPYFWQDPAVKIATQFKSFAMKQGVFLKDFVFDEARKGNLKPLLTFVVGGLAVGEAVGDLKAAVRLRERQGDIFGRVLDNLMTIGGLGLATDFFSNMFYDQTGYGFLKFVVGPTATDLANGTSAVFSDVRRLVEKGPESFAALGQKSEAGKAQSRVGKELVQKVPVVGQIIRGKFFPPRQTYKARTAEENEDIYAELNQKPTAGKKYNIP